jgi:hypothetical protein
LRKELLRYDKIVAPPELVRGAGDAWAFWHAVSKDRGTYDERRKFIDINFTRYYADRLLAGQQTDLASFLERRDLELGVQIGGGGFGDVFRAEHSYAGPRAVKVFRPHFYDGNREALQRFNREALLLSRLAHRRIVRFFDAGVAPGPQPFLITEFIEGESLERQLINRSMLEPDEALEVCSQVLDALSSAHSVGIIHRDIKPSNVMWSNGTATLLDLGSGGIMTDVITTRITKNAQGTVGYMAPELIDDPTLLDPRTDLYSVGVLLHRLLTGRAVQPTDPGHYLAGTNTPPRVLDILRRALAPAAQRYQTSDAMAAAIRTTGVSSSRSPVAATDRPSADTFLMKSEDLMGALGRDRGSVMSPEWLQWTRAELTGTLLSGELRMATRALRATAVLAEVPNAFGFEQLEWVDEESLTHTVRTVLALVDIVPMERLTHTVTSALSKAVAIGLLREDEWDDWHPGMESGTGMRTRYTVTPLGRKTLNHLGFAAPPSPRPSVE